MNKCVVIVSLLVLSVVRCSVMNKQELEEFSDFLKRTSNLDLSLKDGSNLEDVDEEEEPSDNVWEESGKFEGDLILNDRQRRIIVEDVAEGLSRNGLNDITKRWPNNEVIYYIQQEHFTGGQIQAIQEGMQDIGQSSCIKFRPYKKGDRDAVVIQGNRRGCFSQVGYQGGYQVLNLSGRHPVGRGCFRHGTVVHEMLHSLGFYHMQSSHDRDDFINVLWENIIQPARHNFRKYNSFTVSDFGVGYDYDSVLHYSRRAFSSNGRDTLVPKQGGASIGQRTGMSQKDVQKLNKMYCDSDSNNNGEEDEATKRPNKKKNKPFQGHGLGYHQGKAVAIKLPLAKTIQLDSQTYHLFDDFSKSPQALSPTHFEGFGEKLDFRKYIPIYVSEKDIYEPQTTVKTFEHPIEYDSPELSSSTETTEKDNEQQKEDKNNNSTGDIVEFSEEIGENFSNEDDQKRNSTLKEKSLNDHYDEPDVNLNDAFERLEKIIKTHVYPSQTPDLSPYKIKPNNDHYENTEKNYSNEYHEMNMLPAPFDIPETNNDYTSKMQMSPLPIEEYKNKLDALVQNKNIDDENHSSKQSKNEKVIKMAKIETITFIDMSDNGETTSKSSKSNIKNESPEFEYENKVFDKSNEVESELPSSDEFQYEKGFDDRLASILKSYTVIDDYDISSPELNRYKKYYSDDPRAIDNNESSESRMDPKNMHMFERSYYPYDNEFGNLGQHKFHDYPSYKYYKDWFNK